MHTAQIRRAEIDDAPRILEIYAPYVEETSLTFTSRIPSLDEFAQTMLDLKRHYPYLVCCVAGEVVGFAYASRMRPHQAYNWNAELSIYVDEAHHGKGIATALYTALFQLLKLQGYCNLYAVITVPNEASVALHKHFGFKELGIMSKCGFKLGTWHDTLWMELRIQGSVDPLEFGDPKSLDELKPNELATILALSTALLSGAQPGEARAQ